MSAVIAALKAGPWREGPHAWLYEVRNRVGYGGQERYADALVVSCYPSRGIWIAGVEVKIDRSDWKRELDNPSKSAAIQKWCDFWWIAAPAGIVELSEVPETWGLQEVHGARVKTVKPAPRLKPEPLTPSFVASVLRNASASVEAVRKQAHQDGLRAGRAEHSPEAVEVLQARVRELEHEIRMAEAKGRPIDDFRNNVALFERSAGLPEGTISERRWQAQQVDQAARCYRAAHALSEEAYPALAGLERTLRAAADGLGEVMKARTP